MREPLRIAMLDATLAEQPSASGTIGDACDQRQKQRQALHVSAPAQMCKSSGLEAELQAELDKAGVAHRAGDLPEIPIVR